LEFNRSTRTQALEVMETLAENPDDSSARARQKNVNSASEKLNDWVYQQAKRVLKAGKSVGVIGGDHSTPFGAIRAIAEHHGEISILHFDAHSDTRAAYSGFEFSHASIMHNVLTRIPNIKKLVQVGIRDFCEEESAFLKSQGHRARVFYDADLQRRKLSGETFSAIAKEIVSALSPEVYISFDIDGLDPKLCPSTGTPVPGGLEFSEAVFIIRELVRSGRKIIGFDLNEVAPSGVDGDEWDANVGMRLLYKLCGWHFESLGLLKARP
jgi:agmatinase